MSRSAWSDRLPGGTWVEPARRTQADPYLAWADTTGFADFVRGGAPGAEAMWSVLVELVEGVTPAGLAQALGADGKVAPAYQARAELRYCTAEFNAAACRRLAEPGNPLVTRFELTAPVLPQRPLPRPWPVQSPPQAKEPDVCKGNTLLAVIDQGCPFVHAAFLREGVPRVLRLWDQDPSPAFGSAHLPGRVPPGFGYGREVGRAELQALIAVCTGADGVVDEDLCYALARYPELRRAATHGAHVMDQFIGPLRLGDRMGFAGEDSPGWRKNGRLKSDTADLVFVQLPTDAWADPNALALPARVLDALHHVLSCKGKGTRRVVVNLSAAVPTGPHDGSTLFDAALQELVTRERAIDCELRIVVPAGNMAQDRWHAAGTLSAEQDAELCWRMPPGSEAPAFLQVWLSDEAPPGLDAASAYSATARGPVGPLPEKLNWSVRAPGHSAFETVAVDGLGLGLWRGGALLALALPSYGGVRGRGQLLFLALAAASSPDLPGAAGDWHMRLSLPPGARPLAVRAYVGRSVSEMGAPERHRPSRLVDGEYDPERYLRARLSDPAAAPAGVSVQRQGTASALAAGTGVTVVAGLSMGAAVRVCDYSGRGLPPGRSVACVSEEGEALLGIRGAGARSGGVVRLRGTSFAAPQWARALADAPLPAAPRPGSKPPPPALPEPEVVWAGATQDVPPDLGRGLVLPRLRKTALPDRVRRPRVKRL
ncbi:MAG: hypothetical protein Q7U73_18485 [Rubrivivax sp.]|nr:hypothetical protein [Rubrivivax sp.]